MADRQTHVLQTVVVPGGEQCGLCKKVAAVMLELTHRTTKKIAWRRCEECATKEPW